MSPWHVLLVVPLFPGLFDGSRGMPWLPRVSARLPARSPLMIACSVCASILLVRPRALERKLTGQAETRGTISAGINQSQGPNPFTTATTEHGETASRLFVASPFPQGRIRYIAPAEYNKGARKAPMDAQAQTGSGGLASTYLPRQLCIDSAGAALTSQPRTSASQPRNGSSHAANL